MSSPAPKKPVAGQAVAKMPGETVRGLVSLWILFHLLGVTLALATNTDMGRSQLLERIKRTPFLDQYTYALWLNVNYGNRLTGGELDGDPIVEADYVYADGRRETKTIPADNVHGERFERFQALSRRLMPPPDVEAADSTMFAMLGGAILKQQQDEGLKEIVFRVRRHNALSMTDAGATVSSQRDPSNPRTFTNLLTVSVTLDSRGAPQAQIQSQAARDVAPVTGPRSAPRRTAPMPQDNPAPAP